MRRRASTALDGQHDSERHAGCWIAKEINLSTVCFDDLVSHRKSEADSTLPNDVGCVSDRTYNSDF
jgi:hypothetical protein